MVAMYVGTLLPFSKNVMNQKQNVHF